MDAAGAEEEVELDEPAGAAAEEVPEVEPVQVPPLMTWVPAEPLLTPWESTT